MHDVGCYFGAGPTALPDEVKRAFSSSHLSLDGVPLKLYELSHRHPMAIEFIQKSIDNLRLLYAIPSDYEVLFQAGGARHQYELLPINFMHAHTFKIIQSGAWSNIWFKTMAALCGDQASVHSVDLSDYIQDSHSNPNEMLCMVTNETTDGVMLPVDFPSHQLAIADVTSDLGFRQIPISQYALLFAASGKAFGVSGMTIIIVKKDLLQAVRADLPPLQSYSHTSQHQSMYATPPLFCLEMFGHMVEWMLQSGGIDLIEKRQRRRSQKLYALLDRYPVYQPMVSESCRSMHNLCFHIRDGADEKFVAYAQSQGIHGIRGHRMVGGMRINLTHGVCDRAFEKLSQFLKFYGEAFSHG